MHIMCEVKSERVQEGPSPVPVPNYFRIKLIVNSDKRQGVVVLTRNAKQRDNVAC